MRWEEGSECQEKLLTVSTEEVAYEEDEDSGRGGGVGGEDGGECCGLGGRVVERVGEGRREGGGVGRRVY